MSTATSVIDLDLELEEPKTKWKRVAKQVRRSIFGPPESYEPPEITTVKVGSRFIVPDSSSNISIAGWRRLKNKVVEAFHEDGFAAIVGMGAALVAGGISLGFGAPPLAAAGLATLAEDAVFYITKTLEKLAENTSRAFRIARSTQGGAKVFWREFGKGMALDMSKMARRFLPAELADSGGPRELLIAAGIETFTNPMLGIFVGNGISIILFLGIANFADAGMRWVGRNWFSPLLNKIFPGREAKVARRVEQIKTPPNAATFDRRDHHQVNHAQEHRRWVCVNDALNRARASGSQYGLVPAGEVEPDVAVKVWKQTGERYFAANVAMRTALRSIIERGGGAGAFAVQRLDQSERTDRHVSSGNPYWDKLVPLIEEHEALLDIVRPLLTGSNSEARADIGAAIMHSPLRNNIQLRETVQENEVSKLFEGRWTMSAQPETLGLSRVIPVARTVASAA